MADLIPGHHFAIRKNKGGEYVSYFMFGQEPIFWTEGYKTKASAQNAINSILKNGPNAPQHDLSDA
jgi:uncharacterized protein